MQHVTLDDAAIAVLSALVSSNVEIRDAEGKVIGYFRPKLDAARLAQIEPPMSEEELQRREKDSGRRYTIEEAIEFAKKRAEEQGR